LSNYTIVGPNAKLASTIVTNFSLPEQQMSLLIPISVNLNSDPQRGENILMEETSKAMGLIPGLISNSSPLVRFIPGFGQFSLDFTLICTVSSYVDQYVVQHELRKRTSRRLRDERIEFPIRRQEMHVSINHSDEISVAAPKPQQRRQ
jgi:small-conductance mechanosensitive channel